MTTTAWQKKIHKYAIFKPKLGRWNEKSLKYYNGFSGRRLTYYYHEALR